MPEPMRLSRAIRDQPASVRGALVGRVGAAQWGAIDHVQLRNCGVDKDATSRWVRTGRLHPHPKYRGVYAVGHPNLPVEGELTAALLAAGPGATLSYATAAWWWGLIEHQPAVIEISVPSRREPVPGLKLHHPRHLETARHRRLPVTPVIQTLLDYAATATVQRVRRALAEAEYLKRVDLDDVRHALGRGRPGSATLRKALDSHQPELARTRSKLERAFTRLCRTLDVATPEVNVMLCGYLVDALWREQRLVVEVDGLDGHRTPAQRERDYQRDLVLRRNGYTVLRYTYQQVKRHAPEVAEDLKRALAKR
jgi:very-short-patch-repair endonuclease